MIKIKESKLSSSLSGTGAQGGRISLSSTGTGRRQRAAPET